MQHEFNTQNSPFYQTTHSTYSTHTHSAYTESAPFDYASMEAAINA